MTKTQATTKEKCDACGREFDDLAEVFSHDCSVMATLTRPRSPLGNGPKATPKQVAYLIRLGVDEDDANEMSKTNASETIDRLLKAKPVVPISEKQEAFLRSLLAKKRPEMDADETVREINGLPAPSKAASTMIDMLKGQPDAPKAKSATDLVKGDVHVVNGEYYRVHRSQGTNNLYACKWAGSRFDYERGAISKLNAGNKVTAEQAAEFGHMFQRCVFCSTAIDTPESTEVGYGPICASKHGLPWG